MTEDERWLKKTEMAAYLGCSIRSIQYAMKKGMPHTVIVGRIKFRVSEVESWLAENGRMIRREVSD